MFWISKVLTLMLLKMGSLAVFCFHCVVYNNFYFVEMMIINLLVVV